MPINPEKIEKKLSPWSKLISNVKDVVYIVLFLASVIGWIRSETVKNTKLQVQVETLTKAVNENTDQLEKVNSVLTEQQLLNGKIIQYMQMK